MQNPIVMAVDDTEEVRLAIEFCLEKLGIATIHACDGIVALSLLESQTPLAIVTDIEMPNLDGIALLERLHQTHPHVPVFVLSANFEKLEHPSVKKYAAGAFVKSLETIEELCEGLRAYLIL